MQSVLVFFCGWVVADLGVFFAYQYADRIGIRYLGCIGGAAAGFTMMIHAVGVSL